jgi:REP element-mobilizing transposase RayT
MTQRRIYQEEYPNFVTARTQDNFPLFENIEYAELMRGIILGASAIKRFDLLAFQIMADHLHLLATKKHQTDRMLENMRSAGGMDIEFSPERTLSSVRSGVIHKTKSRKKTQFTISDLMQSIKGNFSRVIHQGNIWQPRFYNRLVNTDKYLDTVIQYIISNPIKAKLPNKFHIPPYQYIDWELIGHD